MGRLKTVSRRLDDSQLALNGAKWEEARKREKSTSILKRNEASFLRGSSIKWDDKNIVITRKVDKREPFITEMENVLSDPLSFTETTVFVQLHLLSNVQRGSDLKIMCELFKNSFEPTYETGGKEYNFQQHRALQRVAWAKGAKKDREFKKCKNEETGEAETLMYKLKVTENMRKICSNMNKSNYRALANDESRCHPELEKKCRHAHTQLKRLNVSSLASPETWRQHRGFFHRDRGKREELKYRLKHSLKSLGGSHKVSQSFIEQQKQRTRENKHQYDVFSQFG